MKLILEAIKALFRKVENAIQQSVATLGKRIDSVSASVKRAQSTASKAQTTANNAKESATTAQITADKKMDANNPAGTGSFSMNRKAGTTVGTGSHAEGGDTTASDSYSHAEGYKTIAGKGTITFQATSINAAQHAEGFNTLASGGAAHAEGGFTQATGLFSHAEGHGTIASGKCSHTEGGTEYSDTVVASGDYSHAEGYITTAQGNSQHVQGRFNIIDTVNKYAHIVGNGIKWYNKRSNAHTLDWDGNAWYSGDVYVGSASGTNKDEGSKKLATEEFVSSKIAEAELGGEEVDLSGYALKSELPSRVSQLQNDSGYITGYTETDPTVPAWAKAASKPTYTAAEVGAIPAPTDVKVGQYFKVSSVANGKITGIEAVDPWILSDEVTGTKYKLSVVKGKLTMTESEV